MSRHARQHPRLKKVLDAQTEIVHAITAVEEKYDLTAIEVVKILNEYTALTLKYALRVERHGDLEYPADAPPAPKRKNKAIEVRPRVQPETTS